MNVVEPIRSKEKLVEIKNNLRDSGRKRDWFLFELGINTGLRIGDMLSLNVSHLRDKTRINIRAEKTGKPVSLIINGGLRDSIDSYTFKKAPDDPLFPSRKEGGRLSRSQAFRIIQQAARQVGIEGSIGCHTLRKTFGYHFYQKTKDVAMLQKIFGHSSPAITLRYIGIDQDMVDEVISEFNL